jgi:hypothetical protein
MLVHSQFYMETSFHYALKINGKGEALFSIR